jgi:hypothetical protein
LPISSAKIEARKNHKAKSPLEIARGLFLFLSSSPISPHASAASRP